MDSGCQELKGKADTQSVRIYQFFYHTGIGVQPLQSQEWSASIFSLQYKYKNTRKGYEN